MKRMYCLVVALTVASFNLNAQSLVNKYDASSIVDSLLKNANSITREKEVKFIVKDIDRAVLQVHSIVTVLNELGEEKLNFAAYSSKFQHLEDAEIKVYGSNGKKLNTYSKKEMKNFAYGDGLVEDGKATYFSVSAASFPLTVEQTYTIKYDGILEYPDEYIQGSNEAVEHFMFSAEVPRELGLRYRVLNSSLIPKMGGDAKTISYTWEANNLPAIKRDKHSGPVERFYPNIVIAPNKFKLGGFEGDMSTWKNFGMWSYKLIGDGNQLSEKSRQVILDLIQNQKSDRDKASTIYQYLQENMRYVSIQLGIGGWRPFEANFVQEKKYGDCKALSNYMQAALNVAGIKSYYAIVNAGPNELPALEDFPSSKFNHVILCIPQSKDSMWLECTSNTSDFNELGDFTENRKALLITENGGVLVSTPRSRSEENVFSCRSEVVINEDGTGKVSTIFSGTGEFKQSMVYFFNKRSKDEQIKYLVKIMDWRQPDACEIKSGSRQNTPYVTSANMDYEQLYIFKAGSKMFFQPRFYSFFDEEIEENDKRKQDYFFSNPYVKRDSTMFILPVGFTPEQLPPNKIVKGSFGRYESTYHWDEVNNRVLVTSMIEINQQHIEAKDYHLLLNFKRDVEADLNQRIVIKQK